LLLLPRRAQLIFPLLLTALGLQLLQLPDTGPEKITTAEHNNDTGSSAAASLQHCHQAARQMVDTELGLDKKPSIQPAS
jgi:hypothetical protein